MKKTIVLAALTVLLSACSVKEIDAPTVAAPTIYGYTEDDEATKTAIVFGSDGIGKIWWKPAENINVFFGTTSVKYTSTNTQDASTVVFETSSLIGSTESSTGNKWGLYPYDASATCDGTSVTTSVPASQVCVPESFGSNLFTMIAYTESNELRFKNVCGGIKFSLSRGDIQRITFRGNNVENICGQVKLSFGSDGKPAAEVVTGENTIILTPQNGGAFAKDVNYYLVMLPTVLSSGFTMTFETASEIGTFEYTEKPIEIKRSVFSKKENIDTFATFTENTDAKDLSADGTANCYIVSEYGPCKFDATKKGHTSETVGTIASAEVLWESFGTSTTPSKGDIVNKVSVKNGIVSFTASGKDGNAVIAVKDAAGDILWSWHIWVCQGFDADATAQVYYNNAGTVMDRNLGATSIATNNLRALGLLYQWGRKDPFLSYAYGDSHVDHYAKSTLSWPLPVSSDESNGTIDYVIKHPTTFVTVNTINYDWYYTGNSSTDDTRWHSSKGIFDPCPKGWRVPDGGESGLWAKALGSQASFSGSTVMLGWNFMGILSPSEVWYPQAYCINNSDGTINLYPSGNYWSCTPEGSRVYCRAYSMSIDSSNMDPTHSRVRSVGQSVRCVKESASEPEPDVKDLSADGTANCYIVSEYGPCKFDATKKGHTSETVGTIASAEVLWESFGNDIQPAVGDIVKDVAVKNGIVSFTASGKDGNAVIAVKDVTGDILWSWHIWVCKGFDPNATAQEYYNNAGTVMDRNLGATSATKGDVKALGLLYQWGRKDPFLGSSSISSNTKAKSTITWPSTVSSNSSNGTIDFVVKHPTTFVTRNSSNYDWYYTGSSSTDNTRWNSSKGMYDPCPKGWRVPDGGSNGLWAKAFGTGSYWATSSNWDSTNKGMDFGSTDKKLGSGEIWYPASGYLYSDDGTLHSVGYSGNYWSCTSSGTYAFNLYFYYNGGVDPSCNYPRARGQSVRCLQE